VANEGLIPRHGGYRHLKSFQIAELAYDVTVRFCDRYISRRSRTHDQMVQAARSGKANIAEGSKASGTSKKMELKLTGVAAASLDELRLDYEDFLRQRRLPLWAENDPRRASLIARRCKTADEVAEWIREVHDGPDGRDGRDGRNGRNALRRRGRSIPSISSIPSIPSTPRLTFAEIAANAAHTLTVVAISLIDRQLAALARAFEQDGGFTERLYRVRTATRVWSKPRARARP
jgi:four helix bundle suffix protein